GRFALAGGIDGGVGTRRTSENDESLQALRASARFGAVLLAQPVTLRASAGPSLRYLHQELKLRDGDRIAIGGYPTTSSHASWVPGAVVEIELERAIYGGFLAYVAGRGEADLLRVESRTVASFGASALAGVGLTF